MNTSTNNVIRNALITFANVEKTNGHRSAGSYWVLIIHITYSIYVWYLLKPYRVAIKHSYVKRIAWTK